MAGVACATGVFWLARNELDKNAASLLYLPVVIACAVRLGFGPAIAAATLSFICWDFFFLPPRFTFIVADVRDWLSLIIFLGAAITTARLASNAKLQAEQARARESDISTLYRASDAVSREVDPGRLLAALAQQLATLCESPVCFIFRVRSDGETLAETARADAEGAHYAKSVDAQIEAIRTIAKSAITHDDALGFGTSKDLWIKALSEMGLPDGADYTLIAGVYVPLRAQGTRTGVLYVAPRSDGGAFSSRDEQLIRALANYAAVVLGRQALAAQAAQAEALVAADALKDQILSLASHELRTPLASIKAAATGILSETARYDEHEIRAALGSIASDVDRLATLVSNMLDLSRLEAGSWQPHMDWCDMREIIGTALDRMPDEDSARVEVDIGDDVPLVRADYSQITLVITNLLVNAVKYGRAATPILIRCTVTGQDASRALETCVLNVGEGLDSGDEERVFERFYRSPRYHGGAVHGTGLGLSLCKAIVEAHDGRICARNAAVRGSKGVVFCFTLRLESEK